jgi:ketosteroid isomerase-like protein
MRASILAALGLAAACGGHAPKVSAPAGGDDAMDAARRSLETWRQAWESVSYDAVAARYAHDHDTTIVAQGVAFPGWEKADAHLHEVLEHAKEIRVKLSAVTIDEIDEDCAIAVAQIDRDVSDGAVTTTEHGVVTLVLHRQAGSWLIVSEHYSHPHST